MTSSIDASVSGPITASAQTTVLDTSRKSSASLTLAGTWTGTIQFEATTDNVTWVAIPATPIAGGTAVTSATANGTWALNVSAFVALRVRSSAWSSGTATVAIRASASVGIPTAQTLTTPTYANADTLDAAVVTTTETAFASGFTIPASILQAGKVIRITAALQYTSSGSPPGGNLRAKLGGTTVYQTANGFSLPANKTNNGFALVFLVMGTAAAGASVAVDTAMVQPYEGASSIGGNSIAQPVNLATNGTLAFTITLQYTAGTAGNTTSLRQVIAELIG